MLDTVTTTRPFTDWRALVNERSGARWMFRSPPSKSVRQASAGVPLGARDCAAFLQSAQRDNHTPSRILRTFVEALAEGLPHPGPQPLLKDSGSVMVWSVIPKDIHARAMERARAEGYTITSILRGYILAYAHEQVDCEADKVA